MNKTLATAACDYAQAKADHMNATVALNEATRWRTDSNSMVQRLVTMNAMDCVEWQAAVSELARASYQQGLAEGKEQAALVALDKAENALLLAAGM
jgi:hypothetical protein